MKIITNRQKMNFLMLIMGIVFFFLIGNKGYVVLRDSQGYIDGYSATKIVPLYIYIIKVVKLIFPNSIYLYMVVLLQGVFAICSSFFLSNYISKVFELKQWQRVVVYLLSFLPYAYSLPQEVATHEIMTESIAFSTFYIFFVYYYDSILSKKFYKMGIAICISFLILSMRIQMLILIPVIFIGILSLIVNRFQISKRKVFCTIVFFLMFIVIAMGLVRKNYSQGKFSFLDGTQLMDALLGRAIYISKVEDTNLYNDDNLKDAFLYLYNYADDEQMKYEYVDDNEGMRWENIIVGVNYNIRSSWSELRKFCTENEIDLNEMESMQTDIAFPIIFNHSLLFAENIVELTGVSLMAAIFLQKGSIFSICKLTTIFLYILGICLAIWKRKEEKQIIFYFAVMQILLINVLVLNILFFGLQRYVVYTYGLYHISLFLFIKDALARRNKSTQK